MSLLDNNINTNTTMMMDFADVQKVDTSTMEVGGTASVSSTGSNSLSTKTPCCENNNNNRADGNDCGFIKVVTVLKQEASFLDDESLDDETNSKNIEWAPPKRFNAARFQEYLEPSLKSGHLANNGPLVRLLQTKLKDFCGSRRTVLMAGNGTAALHALAAAWEIQLDKKLRWATQSFTFPSSVQGPFENAIVVDMDKEWIGPCLEKLEHIKNDIDGIVLTNVFGLCHGLLAYEAWCNDNDKLLLLDNAATAVHYLPDGRSIHDVGHGTMISLHESKVIGRGEGGVMIVPDELELSARRALSFGYDPTAAAKDWVEHRSASNWRMSDFSAAAICDHLDTVVQEDWIKRNQDLAQHAMDEMQVKYSDDFRLHPGMSFPNLLPCMYLHVHEKKTDLAKVASYLKNECCIEVKRYYRPLGNPEDIPVALHTFSKSICLPLHVGMTKKDVSYELERLRAGIEMFAIE